MAARNTRTPQAPPMIVLPPDATGMDALLFQKLTEMEMLIRGLPPLLEAIIAHLEAQTKTTAAPPPIATYEQMYGPIEPAEPATAAEPVEMSAPTRPAPIMPVHASRLRRWLMKESG